MTYQPDKMIQQGIRIVKAKNKNSKGLNQVN
jgi:hypothetical protein